MTKKILLRTAKALFFSIVGALVGVAILLTVARAAMPLLGHKRSFFQNWASHALHQPIKIGHITVGWRGFNPVLNFSNVTVLGSKHQQPLVHVNKLEISINLFYSLLKWELLPGHISVEGPQFDVTQDEKGEFSVKGILSSADRHAMSDIGRLKDIVLWMLTQTDISIDDANINWHRSHGQLLKVKHIQLVVDNSVLKHTISGVAFLGAGKKTELRFVLKPHIMDLKSGQWSGDLYFSGKHIALSDWVEERYLQRYIENVKVTEGAADIQAWITWKDGRCKSVQSLVKASNIGLTVYGKPEKHEADKRVQVNEFSANALWKNEADGWLITADQLNLRLNDELWPVHHFQMRARHIAEDQTKVTLDIGFIRLQAIQALAEQVVYWPKKWKETYRHLQPSGDLRDLVLEYTRSADQTTDYRLTTGFENISFLAWNTIPGMTGLTGALTVAPQQGSLMLRAQDSTLESPYLLKKKLDVDQLRFKALWKKKPSRWELRIPEFQLKDDHLAASGQLKAKLPFSGPPKLDLSATFACPEAQYFKEYLPRLSSAPELIEWFDQAFVAGSLTAGKIRFQGAWSDFPFAKGEGRLTVSSQAKGMTLQYAPGWPVIQGFDAGVYLNNESLTITTKKAAVLDGAVSNVKVVIPDLRSPILTATGDVKGDLKTGMQFLRSSPLHITQHIDDVSVKGPMNLHLTIKVPLESASDEVQTIGDLVVRGARLEHPASKIPLTDISGRFHFNNDSVSSKQVTAKLNGDPLLIKVATSYQASHQPVVHLDAKGKLNVSSLQKKGLGLDEVKGLMSYHAKLKLAAHDPNLNAALSIQSNLKGVEVKFPGPFAKQAGQTRSFVLQTTFNKAPIKVHYGDSFFQFSPSKTGWSIHIDHPMIKGSVFVPDNRRATWHGHFSRLHWTPETGQSEAQDPRHIPSLDLYCDDLRYGKWPLGKVELKTQSTSYGLSIKKLSVNSPLFKLTSTGAWWRTGHQQWTIFDGRFDTDDMGKLLSNQGITHALVGGKGGITFKLNWSGAPNKFEIKNTKGDATIHFENGRIVQLSPDAESDLGIGRLLNLLSLQSLPDHLSLNFENQKEGFSFKVLEGHFKMHEGDIETKDTSLIGDIAWVRVKGVIHFLKEQYDLHLNVIPNVTSTLPLVATLLGGPVAGAVTWAANKVLARQIGKAAQFDYRVTGTWKKPSVVELPKPTVTLPSPAHS